MVPKSCQRAFFELASMAHSQGLFPAQSSWPVPDETWSRTYNALYMANPMKSYDAAQWKAYLQVAEAPDEVSVAIWKQLAPLLKKMKNETKWAAPEPAPAPEPAESAPVQEAKSEIVKGAMPSRMWEKFGIKLPEAMSSVLDRIMNKMGTDWLKDMRSQDAEHTMMSVMKTIQEEFVMEMEQNRITEKDIEETVESIKNSMFTMKDKLPPQFQHMMDMMQTKPKSKKKKPHAKAEAAEAEAEPAEPAESMDVTEIASLLTEFVRFTVDMQDQKGPQGAHPFMKKMMKKAMTMMNGPAKAKLSMKEKLARAYAAKYGDEK